MNKYLSNGVIDWINSHRSEHIHYLFCNNQEFVDELHKRINESEEVRTKEDFTNALDEFSAMFLDEGDFGNEQ